MSRILPRPTALTEPYWDGCRAGVLRLQYCQACHLHQFYPRIICSHCGSSQLQWRDSSGRGTLASFTVVRRGISSAYPDNYIVALVDLAEGPRMMSTLVDAEPDQVSIGAVLRVAFEQWSEDMELPVFRLAQK